tara:strand:+ start:376 stop:492 length:117 start_codon:yes stop_codon:yes gene_type:complete
MVALVPALVAPKVLVVVVVLAQLVALALMEMVALEYSG